MIGGDIREVGMIGGDIREVGMIGGDIREEEILEEKEEIIKVGGEDGGEIGMEEEESLEIEKILIEEIEDPNILIMIVMIMKQWRVISLDLMKIKILKMI
jgi:hypothetical protein